MQMPHRVILLARQAFIISGRLLLLLHLHLSRQNAAPVRVAIHAEPTALIPSLLWPVKNRRQILHPLSRGHGHQVLLRLRILRAQVMRPSDVVKPGQVR